MQKIRNSAEMFPIIEAWHSSGLTQKEYGKVHNIPVHVLAYWSVRYRKLKSPVADQAKFIPVTYEKPAAGPLEIVLPNGIIIRFGQPVSVNYLQQVLKGCSV